MGTVTVCTVLHIHSFIYSSIRVHNNTITLKEKTMETKKWFQSKTVWLNIISLLLEVAQAVSGLNIIPAGTLTIITNILNIGLRFITKTSIGTEK